MTKMTRCEGNFILLELQQAIHFAICQQKVGLSVQSTIVLAICGMDKIQGARSLRTIICIWRKFRWEPTMVTTDSGSQSSSLPSSKPQHLFAKFHPLQLLLLKVSGLGRTIRRFKDSYLKIGSPRIEKIQQTALRVSYGNADG